MREVEAHYFTNHTLSAFMRGCTDSSKRDSLVYLHDFQISEASGPNQGSDRGLTPHNESFQPASTSPGRQGVPPASTKDSTYINVADADTTELSCHATSGRGRQGTPVDTTPNFSLSPTDVGYEEEASPTIPGEKPGRLLFQCTHCPKRKPYTQKQVLMRHYREKHQPGFECSHPDCDYKWTRSRSSEYRKHLKKKHRLEDDKIDEILGVPARRRGRRGRVIETDLPPHFSPPPIEHDRQNLAEPQQHPLMLPPLALRKDAHHASPPLVPSVAYNPRLEHAEPEITTTEHEDSSGLEHTAATHAPSALLSEEEFALLVRYLKIPIRKGQIRFPSVHPGGSTTADDILPNPGMLHIPALPSPVGGYHTNPVSGNPMIGVSRSADLIYTPVADYCEIGTNAFVASDGCRVDIDQCKLLVGPSWGFRTYKTDSVSRLTSRVLNVMAPKTDSHVSTIGRGSEARTAPGALCNRAGRNEAAPQGEEIDRQTGREPINVLSSKAKHNLPFRTSSTTTLPRLRLRHPNNDDDDDDCRAQEVAKNKRKSNDPRNGASGRDTDRTQMGLPDLAHHTSTIVAAVGAVLSRLTSGIFLPLNILKEYQ